MESPYLTKRSKENLWTLFASRNTNPSEIMARTSEIPNKPGPVMAILEATVYAPSLYAAHTYKTAAESIHEASAAYAPPPAPTPSNIITEELAIDRANR